MPKVAMSKIRGWVNVRPILKLNYAIPSEPHSQILNQFASDASKKKKKKRILTPRPPCLALPPGGDLATAISQPPKAAVFPRLSFQNISS